MNTLHVPLSFLSGLNPDSLSIKVLSPYNEGFVTVTIKVNHVFTAYFEDFQEWKLVTLLKIYDYLDHKSKERQSVVFCTGEYLEGVFIPDNRTREVERSPDGKYHIMLSPSFIDTLIAESGDPESILHLGT